jgi:hypothetical protein
MLQGAIDILQGLHIWPAIQMAILITGAWFLYEMFAKRS